MFTFFTSFLNKILSAEIFEYDFIYRDELCKKQSPSKLKTFHGDWDSFTSSKPLLKDDEKDVKRRSDSTGLDAKTTIRVKVKMTKQEAARLLSKCKDGGVLEFRDVARELVQIPVHRVNVVHPCAANKAVLHSIPEE